MNKLYLLTLLLGFSISVSAQSESEKTVNATSVDPRISEVFGSESWRVTNDPQRLKDVNDILFKRHEIVQRKRESWEKYPKLSSVPLFNKYNPNLQRDTKVNPEDFNVLKYDLQFFVVRGKMEYRIDDTDLLLVIYPQNPRK